MSSTAFDARIGRAERQFREAFERLKLGKPLHLPKGTKISQNNVAKEAGVDPSALRRSRFPALVEEIHQWLEGRGRTRGPEASARPSVASQKRRNRELRDQVAHMVLERDDALAKLVDAEAYIVQLTEEIQRLSALLPASSATPIRPAEAGKERFSKLALIPRE